MGLADRSGDLRDLRKLKDEDRSIRGTFTLPLNAARLRARQILNEHPTGVPSRSLKVGASFPTVKSNLRCGGFRWRIRKFVNRGRC